MMAPKLLNDNLIRLYLIKALYLYIVLSAVSLLFLTDRWSILAGLTLGGGLSIARLAATNLMVSGLVLQDKDALRGKMRKYLLVQVATILILVASALQGIGFLLGTASGVLLLPAAISIASIVGAFGIKRSRLSKEGADNGFKGKACRRNIP